MLKRISAPAGFLLGLLSLPIYPSPKMLIPVFKSMKDLRHRSLVERLSPATLYQLNYNSSPPQRGSKVEIPWEWGWYIIKTLPFSLLHFSILTRLSCGSLDAKSVSLPPSSFFPSLYGYYKRPDDGIRKTRSEVAPKRKNIAKTFRSKVRFLPPIATLYPEDEQEGTS